MRVVLIPLASFRVPRCCRPPSFFGEGRPGAAVVPAACSGGSRDVARQEGAPGIPRLDAGEAPMNPGAAPPGTEPAAALAWQTLDVNWLRRPPTRADPEPAPGHGVWQAPPAPVRSSLASGRSVRSSERAPR